MYKIRTFIAILLTAAGLALSAQTLTLDSCKALALQNNLTLKNAALDVAAAQEVKKQAFTKYFPNVSAIAGGYYAAKPLFEYGIDDIENASARQFLHNLYYEYGAAMGLPDRITLCENGLMAGAMLVQPVYMGGQIVNGNKLAKVGIEAAELKAQLTEDQVLQQVEEYYWLIISLEEKMKTLQQAKTFLDTLERDVTTASEAGLVSKNDPLKVKLKWYEIHANIEKVRNGISLASDALCQLIGLEHQNSLTLTDTIGEISAWQAQWADPYSAVRGRKETQLLDLQVNAEELKKKMALGETLPHLTVGGTASYGNLIFDHFTANALAFATLQVPLTGWWEASHKLKQQDILIQKAENERTDLIQKMNLETMQAWNNVDDAYNQYQLSELALQDAEANLRDVKADYDAGLVPVSDLLEAQTLLLQAQNQRTDALIDLKIKAEHYKTLTNAH
jgi:outer membrane protein TolC